MYGREASPASRPLDISETGGDGDGASAGTEPTARCSAPSPLRRRDAAASTIASVAGEAARLPSVAAPAVELASAPADDGSALNALGVAAEPITDSRSDVSAAPPVLPPVAALTCDDGVEGGSPSRPSILHLQRLRRWLGSSTVRVNTTATISPPHSYRPGAQSAAAGANWQVGAAQRVQRPMAAGAAFSALQDVPTSTNRVGNTT